VGQVVQHEGVQGQGGALGGGDFSGGHLERRKDDELVETRSGVKVDVDEA
jgi:hypothetical protein